MCGLTGIVSAWLTGHEIIRFQHLALTATFRGKMGGGVTVVPYSDKFMPIDMKHKKSLAHLVLEAEFIDAVYQGKEKKAKLIMGHARYPTTGGHELSDLHPHRAKHIIGMHNGTFTHIRGKKVKDKDNDSALFFRHVADEGIDRAIQQATGEYALTWLDTRADTLNFLRNDKRTLYVGYYDGDIGTLYWHSEAEMLAAVLTREAVWDTDKVVIKAVPSDQHVSYRISNSGGVKPVHMRLCRPGPITTGQRATVPLIADHRSFEMKQEDAMQARGGHSMLETLSGKFLPYADVERIIEKEGCYGCSQPGSMHDFWTGALEWFKLRQFMCAECREKSECRAFMVSEGHMPRPPHINSLPGPQRPTSIG